MKLSSKQKRKLSYIAKQVVDYLQPTSSHPIEVGISCAYNYKHACFSALRLECLHQIQ